MPDASAPSPALDPAALAALEDDIGAEEVAGLLTLVLEDAPRQVAVLTGALAKGDAERATRAAHTLKSLAALLGAGGLRAHCLAVEELARAQRLELAAERQPLLSAELDSVLAVLRTLT